MSSSPTPDWNRLNVGEAERSMLDAARELACNPQRAALASIFKTINVLLIALTVVVVVSVPSMVWTLIHWLIDVR